MGSNRGHVGVQCGGWGHIVLELSVEDRNKLSKRGDFEEGAEHE